MVNRRYWGALWSFKGEATTAERIMQRAGLDSAKPSDLFKIKAKDKGKPGPPHSTPGLRCARGHAATRGA